MGAPGRVGPAGRPVSPRARADDLHAAFADPEVTVVLAAIGGDHAVQLLPISTTA